jgi:hypothetical protein
VSVFGSGDYDRKKKLQLSVWRVVLLCQFSVLAITTGKKEVPVVIKFVLLQLELKLIQIR